jgi:type IV secretory pathway TraG/TraD family ATPase VirD4
MFWTQLAARLLASLLYAAHRVGGTVELVGRWVDRREVDAVTLILENAPEIFSGDAWASSLARDERQLSSVYATAEAILDPLLTSNGGAKPIDPARLLGSSGTLYLCAPAHDQQRHRPLFTVTTSEVISTAFDLARRQGGRLNDPLLIVLDEAAAIAPLAELDVLAATCSSHGITLVTCFQDLAQIQARWATRSTTVVNNHRTRIVLSGLADSGAADLFGTLAGSAVDRGTLRQRSASPVTTSRRSLLEPHEIRGLPHHRGIMVSGRLPATRLALDPWWKIPGLRTRGSRTSATITTAVPGVHGSHDR